MNGYPHLIGIYGHAGVGKDTAANFLCRNFKDTYPEAFAKPLKESCAAAFGIPLSDFYGPPEVKEGLKLPWGMSPREIAQYVGTEMYRALQDDFWIKRLQMRLTGDCIPEDEGPYEDDDTVIITDVRFQNEVDFIINNGGKLLCIKREGYEGNVGIKNHASEQEIDTGGKAWIINNDSTLDSFCKHLIVFGIHANLVLNG